MKYLSPQEILVIHSKIIDLTGGSHGMRDVGLLISLTERPKSSFGGKGSYKGVFEKAAVYLESLANYHVFTDGNKRTGIACTARFLSLNGFALNASNRDIEKFMVKLVTEKLELDMITKWIKKHSKKK